jgi:hypothetical protein
MDGSNDFNAVGYRKPPKNTQFQKGISGNPKGRPKGSKNIATIVDKTGRERITITENGRQRTITKKEAVVLQLTNKAASGDMKAIREHVHLTVICESSQQSSQLPVLDERDRTAFANAVKRIRQAESENVTDTDPQIPLREENK